MSLEIIKVCDLGDSRGEPDWLIDGLWLDGGVGIIGGEPKSYKTFAALSLAIAAASGKDCFGHYPVRRSGPVLLFAAEDSLAMVRERIAGIALGMGADFTELDIHIIAEPQLRIDTTTDRQRLEEAIVDIKPVLLVLDPFVRLHSIDENSSGEVARLLSWLRGLQRKFSLNVAMVHHARKRAGRERPGQSLRGSSELHAWGDSNLYLRRTLDEDNYVQLVIEHRAAPSDNNVRLRFHEAEEGPHLVYEGGGIAKPQQLSPTERILGALRECEEPLSGDNLRRASGIKASTFWKTLREMNESGAIGKSQDQLYHPIPAS